MEEELHYLDGMDGIVIWFGLVWSGLVSFWMGPDQLGLDC